MGLIIFGIESFMMGRKEVGGKTEKTSQCG
jgi:hypothetical protein